MAQYMYRKPGEATFSAGRNELEAILKSSPETQVAQIGKNIWVSADHFLKYGDTAFEASESPVEGADQESLAQKIFDTTITTESWVEGVEARFGIVKSECVYGMNIVKDIFAGARDMFGGRSATVEKGVHEALEAVVEGLKKRCGKEGCKCCRWSSVLSVKHVRNRNIHDHGFCDRNRRQTEIILISHF